MQGTLVITGVGAFAILKILKSIWDKDQLQAQRLILGPQRDEDLFRSELESWLHFSNEYQLFSHQKIKEGRRYREIFIFDRVTTLEKSNASIPNC